MKRTDRSDPSSVFSRRSFLKTGSLVAGGSVALSAERALGQEDAAEKEAPVARAHRLLGRTGFKASDISFGCVALTQPNVFRYAYDHGINYFDTAESYGQGASETALGEGMAHVDRKKIFINTKVVVREDDTEQTLVDRLGGCLERLQTDYVDCLCTHSVKKVEYKDNPHFHAAVDRLKADGKVRFKGITSHGPSTDDQDSMEAVLTAAAEDGRFDLMLLTYGMLNEEAGNRILAACKKNDVATTAMKYAPADRLEVPPFDAENPNQEYAEAIERMAGRGLSREAAIERIENWIADTTEQIANLKPFIDTHGITTVEVLRQKAIQWVLQNPDMQTVTVTMNAFEDVDMFLGLSGTKLAEAGAMLQRDAKRALGDRYCRHSCRDCAGACPHDMPVSTIMRYAYYFQGQGREKEAMRKYAGLKGNNASLCLGCPAPCDGACPHGVDIQGSLFRADMTLRLV